MAKGPWRTFAASWLCDARFRTFNAATAPWPRITSCASRPGTFPAIIQCGHGQGTVENLRRFLALRCAVSYLQCGHGPLAADNLLRIEAGDFPRDHSMRPWPRDRGEPSPLPGFAMRGFVPSMRPRPLGRGEPPAHRGRGLSPRSFNAAMAKGPWRTFA